MTPKPLHKNIRERIEQILTTGDDAEELMNMMPEVLAAEAFWREVVKNSEWRGELGECFYCGGTTELADIGGGRVVGRTRHTNTCPWNLAQGTEESA